MAKRSVLFCVPVLIAGVLATSAPLAGAVLPSGTTPVLVSAGSTTSAIDGHLHAAASIAGVLKAASGGTVGGVVSVYLNGRSVRSAIASSSDGAYVVSGLPASTTGYDVCAGAIDLFDGSSTTGYQGRCYKTAAFDGVHVPAGATEVPLTAGQHKSGVGITFPSAAAISGKIMNGAHVGVGSVSILAKNRSSGARFTGFTAGDGTYRVENLPPSAKGYSVCADTAFASAGNTGYRPRCYKNAAWNGGSIPAGATAVSVSAGHTHSGVNITVRPGAAISGKVTAAGSGAPLGSTDVAVFNTSGGFVTGVETNAHGVYKARDLATGSYDVCVDPRSGSQPGVSYQGQCWNDVAWNGAGAPPHAAVEVGTSIGHVHTGITFKLTKVTVHLGSISGTITEAGDFGLQNATVQLFGTSGASGSELATAVTDADGAFSFDGVFPYATGYRICASAQTATFAPTGPGSSTGWAPRCYDNVAWNGLAVPPGATRVPISAGQDKIGVNITLQPGGGISGTTFQFGGSTPAGNVDVDVYTHSGGLIGHVLSGFNDGTYSLVNLPPSDTGYVVCFDGRSAQFGSAAGWLPQCFDKVAWDGTG